MKPELFLALNILSALAWGQPISLESTTIHPFSSEIFNYWRGSKVSGINPEYAFNVTVYHEYPKEYFNANELLVEQNSGDLNGDLYFILRSFLLPLECQPWVDDIKKFDCKNREQTEVDNLVSKHIVTFDKRFGPYGHCLLHGKGEQQHYRCLCYKQLSCRSLLPRFCTSKVGFEDVREGHGTCLPTSTDEDFVWWRFNLARKFGGQWYSTPRRGQCKPKRIEVKEGQQLVRDGQSSPCSWQIQETVSTIKSSCLRARIIKGVSKQNSGCFSTCDSLKRKNVTKYDLCFSRCMMYTILGPDSDKVKVDSSSGLPNKILTDLFHSAFDNITGCPQLY